MNYTPQTPVGITPPENTTTEQKEEDPQSSAQHGDEKNDKTVENNQESPSCEVELSARKCDFHSTIDQIRRHFAEIEAERRERFENECKEIFPEHEVRRVLTFFDKESTLDCEESTCVKRKDAFLTPGPRVMTRQALNGKANCFPVSQVKRMPGSSDKLILSCTKQELSEINPGALLKGREFEFWRAFSATPRDQIPDMASFLDNLRVKSPKLGREVSDIAGLGWLRSSSPANQDPMSELQSVNAQLRHRVKDLEGELCEAVFRQSLAESAYQQSMLQMDELLSKLDDSSDRISELETCHDLNVEEKSEVSSQLQHTEKRVFELGVSLRKTEEENGELERKLIEAQKNIQRLSLQLQLATKQRQQLIYEAEEEKELSRALQQENVSLKKTLLACRKTAELYKDKASNNETVEEELKANNSKFKRRTKELEEQVNSLQNELRESERSQLELQDELWQTQRILDEVKSDYEIVSEEKHAINEELKAFYEQHQELKMTYSQCVHEKTEKEQQIAVLVAKVEDSQSEVAYLHHKDAELAKGDEKEEQTPNRHERSMMDGEDLHPLPENEDTITISLACVRSPYVSDGVNPAVYFFDLQEGSETLDNQPSEKENLERIQSEDRDTLVRKEEILAIESLFKQCKEQQNSLENDLANNEGKIHSLQDELVLSYQDRLEAYKKVSRLQTEHGNMKVAFEKCEKEKGDLMKKASQLSRRISHLKKKCESEQVEKRLLQQQLRLNAQKNDGDRSEIHRISQRFMEQNLLLDASEFGMNFI